MGWLRDTLRALGWAVAAAVLGVVLLSSRAVHGLIPHLLPLAAAPVGAYWYHRSKRVTWLTAAWVLVFVVATVLWVLWAFRDFRFRAIQG